jgi:hypothetical protein
VGAVVRRHHSSSRNFPAAQVREPAGGKLPNVPEAPERPKARWLLPHRLADGLRQRPEPLLVLFEQKNCAACDELHGEAFRRSEAAALLSWMRRDGDDCNFALIRAIAPKDPVVTGRAVLNVRLEDLRVRIVGVLDQGKFVLAVFPCALEWFRRTVRSGEPENKFALGSRSSCIRVT